MMEGQGDMSPVHASGPLGEGQGHPYKGMSPVPGGTPEGTGTGKCSACLRLYPLSDLTAYWPTAGVVEVRYVCRPSLARVAQGECFRAVVDWVGVHAISTTEGLA
jgi:hypothetical protein